MFVWIVLPELSSFWKYSFFLVFSVGMVVFLEVLEKKSKKMAEGKQTKFPFIRDRHWQAIEPCRKEYNKLMELTPKYNQYLDDLGLTNQWEIELELGEEPDIIYILYKGSNMQANDYLSKLNYCVQYLNHKDVLKRLVDSLAEEIKTELQALIVDFGHLIEGEFTDKERKHLNLERVAQRIVDVPVMFFIKDTCTISDTNPKNEEYISFDITERMLKDLYEFYKPMFKQNSI